MKSSYSNIRNMYQVVLNLLESFISVWTGYTPFSDAVTEFKSDVTVIDNTKEQQQKLLKGYTLNKYKLKREMAVLGEIMGSKVSAYAADIGDSVLFKSMQISFSKLYFNKDTEAIGFANLINNAAIAMAAVDKTKYKISDGDLLALQTAITQFTNVPSPAQVRAIRKQLTESFPKLFTTTTAVLTDKLDNLIAEFKLTNPDFYGQYFNGRRTYTSHRHTTLIGLAQDSTTGADLQNVEVLLVSSADSFEEMTDSQGEFKQQINPEIDYSAKFIIPGYETEELEKINLNRGEHKKLIVKLKKLPTA